MAKRQKQIRPKARLPKGLQDIGAGETRSMNRMLETIRGVFESYGFEPLETPAFEYSDALGKFLPDQDRPNEGVFSFEDEDRQWLSLRYDLTAPLARYVAENFDALAKPFRRYQTGPVWRNEKPGPGRFRQFTQFDADTVGTESVAADAEMCMLAADTLEALDIPRGEYAIKVNNRKVLDGVMATANIPPEKHPEVLRAIDKFDRLGEDAVEQLLGRGRKDESGDFTKGALLTEGQIEAIMRLIYIPSEVDHALWDAADMEDDLAKELQSEQGYEEHLGLGVSGWLAEQLINSPEGLRGIAELREIWKLVSAAGYNDGRIRIDPSVVRGLEYYTGPVFEAELTFETKDEKGNPVRFGSVGGGGRYDGLVERFRGTKVPATGFSIGVSRLHTALRHLGKLAESASEGPVIVLVMERDRLTDYQKFARDLRQSGIRAEMYLGTSGMRAQMKYADKRGAPCVIIQGEDERARGEVTIKDLVEGERLSAEIADNREWREGRPAQFSVAEGDMVEAVRAVLARQSGPSGPDQGTS